LIVGCRDGDGLAASALGCSGSGALPGLTKLREQRERKRYKKPPKIQMELISDSEQRRGINASSATQQIIETVLRSMA